MKEKILVEKSTMSVGDYDNDQSSSYLIHFSEIEKHLSEGWVIKQMSILPYGANGVNKATDLIITVHLQRL
ncbi:hypothetical protein [Bacteroides neonati]|uniref:hypothetical protein n=1 Tax=Bacteroides neonati TaxID=1347393 RepID=UPI0004BCEC6B|nr:hypothetical protein [Bacteroides neonati]